MSFPETVVPAEFFDDLLASPDESIEVVETLVRAAQRVDIPTEDRRLPHDEEKTGPSDCSVDVQFGL